MPLIVFHFSKIQSQKAFWLGAQSRTPLSELTMQQFHRPPSLMRSDTSSSSIPHNASQIQFASFIHSSILLLLFSVVYGGLYPVQFQLVRYERGFTYKVAQKPRCQREFITRHFCMELHHTLTDFQHPFSVRESVMKFAVKALLKIPPHLDSLLH